MGGEYQGHGTACEFVECVLPTDPADLNGDGVVDVADLLELLAQWGACADPPEPCTADLDGNGQVDVADLLQLLAAWDP
jgi:hypothetical protein